MLVLYAHRTNKKKIGLNFHKSRYNRRPEIFVHSSFFSQWRIGIEEKSVNWRKKNIHYHTYRIFLFRLQFRRFFFYTIILFYFGIFFFFFCCCSIARGCSISHKTFLILQIEECKINYTKNPYIYVYKSCVDLNENAYSSNVVCAWMDGWTGKHSTGSMVKRMTKNWTVLTADSLISANVLADKSKFCPVFHYNGHKRTLIAHAFEFQTYPIKLHI